MTDPNLPTSYNVPEADNSSTRYQSNPNDGGGPSYSGGGDVSILDKFKGYTLSINGILKLSQIAALLLAMIFAGACCKGYAPRNFFIVISILFFLATIVFFLIYALQLHHKLPGLPWLLIELVFNGAAILLLFLACVIVWAKSGGSALLVIGGILGLIALILYGASGVFGFFEWRAGGDPAGNVAI